LFRVSRDGRTVGPWVRPFGKVRLGAKRVGFVGFLDVWMFGSSDLHGFKLERGLPLSRLDQCCRVAHRVAAVGSHVPCDHVSSASGVWTRRTLVRLLPSVRSLVGRQVVASGEHLIAHSTGVGFESCVQPNMPCQHVTPCKASTTNLTEVSLGLGLNLVRLVPRCHVLGQAIVEGELLSTDGTAVG